jgi:hypothetical protein
VWWCLDLFYYFLLYWQVEALEALLKRHKLTGQPDLLGRVQLMEAKAAAQEAVRAAEKEVKASKSIILKDELKGRLRVGRPAPQRATLNPKSQNPNFLKTEKHLATFHAIQGN